MSRCAARRASDASFDRNMGAHSRMSGPVRAQNTSLSNAAPIAGNSTACYAAAGARRCSTSPTRHLTSMIDAETAAMAPVVVAGTEDRSVVGIMVDFAKSAPFHLNPSTWDGSTLVFCRGALGGAPVSRRTPLRRGGLPGAEGPRTTRRSLGCWLTFAAVDARSAEAPSAQWLYFARN